jgi:hypothetical protein
VIGQRCNPEEDVGKYRFGGKEKEKKERKQTTKALIP